MREPAINLALIRINVVSPRAIRTEMFDSIPDDGLEGALEVYRQPSLTDSLGTPEEASGAYISQLTDSFATGRVVTVHGDRLLKFGRV